MKITHCNITSGDDAICLKTGKDAPCKIIEVSDCVIDTATTGLKIGTATESDFRHIHSHNCKITSNIEGVGLFMRHAGTAQDVMAEDLEITIRGKSGPSLYIMVEKSPDGLKMGAVRDVTFQNIHITSAAGILLQGRPESRIENLTLRNITLDVRNPHEYKSRKAPLRRQTGSP